MRAIIGWSALLLSFAINSEYSLAEVGKTTAPLIREGEVYIWNSDPLETINFTITGDKCDSLLNASLRPDHANTFTCNGADHFIITIRTDHVGGYGGGYVTKEYKLEVSGRYSLFYNESIQAWDVGLITTR